MRSSPILLLALLAACGGSPEEELLGTWEADEALKRRRFARDALANATFEFTFTKTELRIKVAGGGQGESEQRHLYVIAKKEGRRLWLEQPEGQLKFEMVVEVNGDELIGIRGNDRFRLTRK